FCLIHVVYTCCLLCILLLFHPPLFFFFFNDTATTAIYTLSLHDALPIFYTACRPCQLFSQLFFLFRSGLSLERSRYYKNRFGLRSEEHTSELQSRENLVCRLLLEKKKR